ncbi:MAG TPA: hypothetical protein VG122_23415 [Gemmata sp.]|jgi:hypothetical protein|nr:hypothetical protein [Gemmata sp.]
MTEDQIEKIAQALVVSQTESIASLVENFGTKLIESSRVIINDFDGSEDYKRGAHAALGTVSAILASALPKMRERLKKN